MTCFVALIVETSFKRGAKSILHNISIDGISTNDERTHVGCRILGFNVI